MGGFGGQQRRPHPTCSDKTAVLWEVGVDLTLPHPHTLRRHPVGPRPYIAGILVAALKLPACTSGHLQALV